VVGVEGESRLIGLARSAAHGRAADKVEIEPELWLGIGTTRVSSTSQRVAALLDFLTRLRGPILGPSVTVHPGWVEPHR